MDSKMDSNKSTHTTDTPYDELLVWPPQLTLVRMRQREQVYENDLCTVCGQPRWK